MESFTFALDPALSGAPVASGSGLTYVEDYTDDESGRDEQDELSGSGEDDDSQLESDDTDAEDEYNTQMMRGMVSQGPMPPPKRKKVAVAKGKGKMREDRAVTSFDDENDDEFDRLVSDIREQSGADVGLRTALDREYDRTIEEELDGIDDPLGITVKKGPKKRGRKPGRDVEPSPEVKNLLGTASRHYANGEYAKAEELLTEIIRIDPTIRQSWFTLATIYEERGNMEKSFMFKIVATHLSSARSASSDWNHLGIQSRNIGLIQQAIYCYTQAIKCDKLDIDSMWDRAVLLKTTGNVKLAATGFSAILDIHPHDPLVLMQLAPLLVQLDATDQALELCLAAYTHLREKEPHVSLNQQTSFFDEAALALLAELLTLRGRSSEAVHLIRSGARWLQGREKETGWDVLDDDREFDLKRQTRLGWEKDAKYLEQVKVFALDRRLRARLGIARLYQDRISEAKLHFAIVESEPPSDCPELHTAIAEAWITKSMWSEAIEMYQLLSSNEATNAANIWARLGHCQAQLGQYDGAIECYKAVIDEEPHNLEVKIQLAGVYESMGDGNLAWDLIEEVNREKERRYVAGEEDPAGAVGGRKSRRAPSKADRLAAAEAAATRDQQDAMEISIAFTRLDGTYRAAFANFQGARADWLQVGTLLVDRFRETKLLFPADKFKKYTGLSRKWRRKDAKNDIETQAGEMTSRLRRERENQDTEIGVDTYRGAPFDRWLEVIIKYAFLLTMNGEDEAAQETLMHVGNASPFVQSEPRSLALKLARCACYHHVSDHVNIMEVCRWIWLRHQYQTDPLRLLQTLLSSGQSAMHAFNSSNLQKFAIRQIRQIETIAQGGEVKLGRRGILVVTAPAKGKGKSKAKEVERDDEVPAEDEADDEATRNEEQEHSDLAKFKPTRPNPVYYLSYGNMVMTSRSYHVAITYLTRAQEAFPSQALPPLCLGIAFLHRAMQRQTDNRHYQIIQALAFIGLYRERRGVSQEVSYNLGRTFQHLGLNDMAVRHYEMVLELSTESRLVLMDIDGEVDDPDDFSLLAAYNLSLLHILTGNMLMAREITKKWLGC